VLDLLLCDSGNPRSLAFNWRPLSEHAANLPRDPRAPEVLAEQKRLAGLTALLRDTTWRPWPAPANSAARKR